MTRRRIHLICNAHLDPVWQWRWEEGAAEALNTFRTAVEMLHEHPDLIFNHNEAVLYEWVRRYDPRLFRDIQELVRRKRWHISGGWYLQPDVNLPPIESIVRHIREGRRFFKAYFDAEPYVAYNFDSFGHGGGLPQVLRQAGYEMYVHMRPDAADLTLPADLYRWRGVDGTEIPVQRIEVGLYHTEYGNIDQRISEGVALAAKLDRDVAVFWGIGDHGGGATREDLERIDARIRLEDGVEIIHSTPELLYEALREEIRHAPVVEGDIQRIWTGTYTSLSRIKRRAQQGLSQLVQTEALATAAWWLHDAPFPEEALTEAWRNHLFNDFHDVLPGTCTEPAEREALEIYGRTAETLRRIRLGTAVHFQHGPAERAYLPVTVQHANPAARQVPVEVECMISHRPKWSGRWHLRLYTPDGREMPCQEEQPEALLPFNDWRRRVVFFPELPSLGAASYRLELHEGTREQAASEPALSHTVDPTSGLVTHLGAEGSNLLTGPLLQPLVVEDLGDSWGTDAWAYRTVLGAFEADERGAVLIEQGPIRTIHETTFRYGRSEIVAQTIAYAAWPVLELRFRIHWHEERRRLKLAVPTTFRTERVECEIPGGTIERPADGDEHVHGRWFVVEGTVGDTPVALAVVNDGQNGLDVADGEVRLSVLRSAAYCHHKDFDLGASRRFKYMDQGVHDVRLLVTYGDPEAVRSRLPGLAEWLTAPPVALAHLPAGSPAASADAAQPEGRGDVLADLLTVSPDSVRMLACRPGADGVSLIVRLQATRRAETEATVVLGTPAAEIELRFRPLEIKTIRVDRSGRWQEVHPITEQ